MEGKYYMGSWLIGSEAMWRNCKQDFEVLLQVTAWKMDLKDRKVGRAGLGVVRVECSPTVLVEVLEYWKLVQILWKNHFRAYCTFCKRRKMWFSKIILP